MTDVPANFWAVVPAAGIGSRMRAGKPKQYLTIGDRSVLEHTLARLTAHPLIAGVVIALAEHDDYWPGLRHLPVKPLHRVTGGAERCHSVLHCLHYLQATQAPDTWVLVHDAARPCVRSTDIDNLILRCRDHEVGGLLGIPVHDTMKRCDTAGAVLDTVDRRQLWHAMTPQMFRLHQLADALQQALARELLVTDEASAMEALGLHPVMVEATADNIKITRPEDLALAAFYLDQQGAPPCA